MKHRHERVFLWVCERFKLNPSYWIPHLKPEGLLEWGTSYGSAEEMIGEDGKLGDGTPVPIPCFSIYSAFETICRERAKQRLGLTDDDSWAGKKLGFWYAFWGFLAEVDMGVFDTTAWVEVGEGLTDGDTKMFRHHN